VPTGGGEFLGGFFFHFFFRGGPFYFGGGGGANPRRLQLAGMTKALLSWIWRPGPKRKNGNQRVLEDDAAWLVGWICPRLIALRSLNGLPKRLKVLRPSGIPSFQMLDQKNDLRLFQKTL